MKSDLWITRQHDKNMSAANARRLPASGNHIWKPASTTDAVQAAIVTTMNNTATINARLLGHVVATVLLAATAMVVAWQVLFTDPGITVNRYSPGRVSSTGFGGPAVQTGYRPGTRVVGIQHDPLPSGVPHAQ